MSDRRPHLDIEVVIMDIHVIIVIQEMNTFFNKNLYSYYLKSSILNSYYTELADLNQD